MKKFIYLLVLPGLIGFGACAKYVDGYDTNPNFPTSGTPATLLTATQVATFGNSHTSLSRTAGILTQQLAGVQLSVEPIDVYNIQEGDLTNEWKLLYRGIVGSQSLINTAGQSNRAYRGIGKVLKALNLGIGSDFWGGIPNSEALQGASNLSPKFDSQEEIYTEIQNLLNSAIVDLRSDQNLLSPDNDDLIYGGDNSKWIGAAFALKARHSMRLSKKGNSHIVDALRYIDSARANDFFAPGGEMMSNYTTNGGSQNPWYSYQRERNGYIKISGVFTDLLNGINDPRRDFYFDTTGTNANIFFGSPLNRVSIDSAAKVGSYFARNNSNLPLISTTELDFIRAEALFRTGALGSAATAHNDAINAHILKVTGSAAPSSYQTSQTNEDATSISLEKIMTHKYVASFTSSEVWHDWRRTGFPVLTPNPRALNRAPIPRHMPIPLEERLYNTNSPSSITLNTRMWWDQ